MLSKGLDFKNVDLVGVINADNLIYFPDFRAQEKCFQLIQQVAGRSGRSKSQGKVIVQTYNPNHKVMLKIKSSDYLGMFNDQLSERHTFDYPPYSRIIKIILKDKNIDKIKISATWLSESLKTNFDKFIFGPEFPLIPRVQNKYINNIQIKIPTDLNLKKSKKIILKTISKVHETYISDEILMSLRRLTIMFLFANLYFLFLYHITNMYIAKHLDYEIFILLDGGVYTFAFWIGQLLVGIIVPIFLINSQRICKELSLIVSSVLILLGSFVAMYVIIIAGQAAGLDPTQWDNPQEFDITRDLNGNIVFGTGAHVCAGLFLAKSQAKLMLLEFMKRFPNATLQEMPTRDPDHYNARHVTKLLVKTNI